MKLMESKCSRVVQVCSPSHENKSPVEDEQFCGGQSCTLRVETEVFLVQISNKAQTLDQRLCVR